VAGLVLGRGEDAVRAWGRLPAGTKAAYVRFPRESDLPLAAVQRLARRGRIVVDAAPRDAGDVLDLAVAGAAAVVAWLADGGDVAAMAEAMGDGLLVGCTAQDIGRASRLALDLGVPLLVAGAEPPQEGHGYLIDPLAQPLALRRFGAWPDLHPEAPNKGAAEESEGEAAAAEGDAEGR
jgi:hypothetical protein